MYYNRQHTPKPKRTAAYARRSSGLPQLLTARQMAEIRKYAKRQELEVVMNYLDEAKGGKKP